MSGDVQSFRLPMPRHERRHQWLPLLLDCYAIIDLSVAESIGQSGKKIACSKGCTACCHHIIPVSVLECLGIKFYFHTLLPQETRSCLLQKINEHTELCLFNIDGCCSIYPLRPIACRRYIVCSQQCTIDEEPAITRKDDVLEPSREYLVRAVEKTLPFYRTRNMPVLENESAFDVYKRNNVQLSSVYANILQPSDMK